MVTGPWYVYIITNGAGILYTGISNEPNRRVEEHNSDTGARFTRGKGPWRIVYLETYETKSEALKREYAVKQLSKAKKLRLLTLGYS